MTAVAADVDIAELQEERDFLLGSLEDLEREWQAGDLEEPDYRSLKDSYTARAAAVLRTIEAATAAGAGTTEDPATTSDSAGPAAESPPGAGRRRRTWLRPAITAAVVVCLAGVAGTLMARSAGERLPGEAATGSLTATGPSSGLERARLLIGQGKTLEAIKAYDEVLRQDPNQPEALAYRGWLLRLAGRAGANQSLVDSGLAFIDRAVAADPTYPDARFFRGLILYQDRRDAAGAVAEFRAFLANDPPPGMVPVVEDTLRRALADLEAAPTAPAPPPTPAPR